MRRPLAVLAALGVLAATIGAAPGQAATGLDRRRAAQHLLRRFAFSASPEEVSRVVDIGREGWLTEQLASALKAPSPDGVLEAKPRTSNEKGELLDPVVYERRLVQREIGSPEQLREKLVLHWIDHFAVGMAKTEPWLLSRYEDTLRVNALGNFKRLLINVSREGAVLQWLDNTYNDGSDPQKSPPNENFARELLQLYSVGPTRLDTDGGGVRDSTGRPMANYTEVDVKALARALTGFALDCEDYQKVRDPERRCHVSFAAERHTPGKTKRILGKTIDDPGNAKILDAAINVIVRLPSVAPFQAKELIQRFVTETPSPAYVAAIAEVWRANVDAPDQLARVIRAVVLHPEFDTSYHALRKEPAEVAVDAVRQLPVTLKTGQDKDGTYGPGLDLVGDGGYLAKMGQQLYAPPSVFSFYRPGHKDELITDQFLANRFKFANGLANSSADAPESNTALDSNELFNRIGSNDGPAVANYLLDAMADGGTSTLQRAIHLYLRGEVDDAHLRGAVWLIMTAPEYQLN